MLLNCFLFVVFSGVFVTQFISAVKALRFADIPLVFVSRALSQLPVMPLVGPESLAVIRFANSCISPVISVLLRKWWVNHILCNKVRRTMSCLILSVQILMGGGSNDLEWIKCPSK